MLQPLLPWNAILCYRRRIAGRAHLPRKRVGLLDRRKRIRRSLAGLEVGMRAARIICNETSRGVGGACTWFAAATVSAEDDDAACSPKHCSFVIWCSGGKKVLKSIMRLGLPANSVDTFRITRLVSILFMQVWQERGELCERGTLAHAAAAHAAAAARAREGGGGRRHSHVWRLNSFMMSRNSL